MTRKNQLLSVILAVVVLFGLFALGRTFLFSPKNDITQAAVGTMRGEVPSPGTQQTRCSSSGCTVYLTWPASSTISGQTNFQVSFMPDYASSAGVEFIPANGNSNGQPNTYCRYQDTSGWHDGFYQDSTYTWHALCDTMAFANGGYKIKIYAYYSDGLSMSLLREDSPEPIFEPFTINNTFSIDSPSNNSAVSGTVSLHTTLSGDVNTVRFLIGNNTIEAQKTYGDSNRSIWSTTWDSNSISNGQYKVNLSFTSLGGVQRDNIASSTITINNKTTPPPCTPSWSCTDWSACPISEIQTRTCTDRNSCGSDLNKLAETQTCTYTPPANQNTNVNQNINQNLNKALNTNQIVYQTCRTSCPDGTKWSACVDSKQTRSCSNECGGTINEERACTIVKPVEAISVAVPDKPTITSPQTNAQIDNPQPVVEGQSQPGMKVNIYLDGNFNGSALVGDDGKFSYRFPYALKTGKYTVKAEAENSNQQKSEQTEGVVFEILAPKINMTIPKEGDVVTGQITLTAEIKGVVSTAEFYWDLEGGNTKANTNVLIGEAGPTKTNASVWGKVMGYF